MLVKSIPSNADFIKASRKIKLHLALIRVGFLRDRFAVGGG